MKTSSQLSLDIQVEIIKRLPVKSLIRFRSVCKAWKSLIDSSQFIADYNVHPHHHLMIRYEVGDGEEPDEVKYVCFVDDDDTFPPQEFAPTVPPILQLLHQSRIIDSSDGLFCLAGYYQEPDYSFTKEIVVLWNPSIRKSIAVVVPNSGGCIHVVGFGVCPDTKDPKLVKITYSEVPRKRERISYICQVMVFTLSSGEWTTSFTNQLPPISIQFGRNDQITIGQFIYWRAGGFNDLIMSFDLSTDEFREIELPHSLRQSKLSISRLRESLVLLDYNRNSTTNKKVCDVWMMEYGDPKAFTKLFTIKPPDASVAKTVGFRNSGEPIIGMHVDDDEEDDDEYEDLHSQCALVVYEPCLEHIKDLGIHGPKHSLFASSYTESLLLLDHDDGHNTL